MTQDFNLERYLTGGVENIVKNIMRATLTNPKESLFISKYALASKEAARVRRQAEENGEHVPPFLIASITSSCNLHCTGCYARTNLSCCDSGITKQLTDKEWLEIFKEARELGIGFILLAGGEPFLRKDVIEAAGLVPEILFPIFTNGTMLTEEYLKLLDRYRNLIPILSIEGNKEKTDERRGYGIYDKLCKAMKLLKKNKILFGASVTVTTENLQEVTSKDFIDQLSKEDCKGVFYIEYVPVTKESRKLAPKDADRSYMQEAISRLREEYKHILFISFPGDEKSSGGCLAAGRGFFHINTQGGAEPCPFSPYSDINVRETSLKEALQSRLFQELKKGELLLEEHEGGCILFEHREQVEGILKVQSLKSEKSQDNK